MATEIDQILSVDYLRNHNVELEPGNRFEFIPIGMGPLPKSNIDKTIAEQHPGDPKYYLLDSQEVFRGFCKSTGVPHKNNAVKSTQWVNGAFYTQGSGGWDPISIEFLSSTTKPVRSYLRAWKRLSDELSKTIGRAKDYKFDCILIEYSADNEQIARYELKGCFCQDVTETNFDKTSDSSARYVTGKFYFDDCIETYYEVEE